MTLLLVPTVHRLSRNPKTRANWGSLYVSQDRVRRTQAILESRIFRTPLASGSLDTLRTVGTSYNGAAGLLFPNLTSGIKKISSTQRWNPVAPGFDFPMAMMAMLVRVSNARWPTLRKNGAAFDVLCRLHNRYSLERDDEVTRG